MNGDGRVSIPRAGARMRAMCGWLRAGAVLVVACMVGGAMFLPSRSDAATFRVVDAETGEPLEGAVVVVVWNWYPPALEGHKEPYQVVERVTTADGTFSGALWPGLPLPLERRDVLVFKPGYRPRVAQTSDRWAPLFAQTDVGLTKIVSLQEARRYHLPRDLGAAVCLGEGGMGCVQRSQVPHLMRAMAIHQKIYAPSPGGISPAEEGRQ